METTVISTQTREAYIKISVHPFKSASEEDLYKKMIQAIPTVETLFGKSSDDYFKNVKTAVDKFGNSMLKAYKEDSSRRDNIILSDIYLPLPDSINDSYSQSFQVSEYDFDNAIMGYGLNKVLEGFRNHKNANVSNTIEDILSATAQLGTRSNMSINPNTLHVYTGSLPRSFDFNFKFVPRSLTEANDIINAIEKLRNYSLGTKKSLVVDSTLKINLDIIKTEHCFSISYHKRRNDATGYTGTDDLEELTYLKDLMFTGVEAPSNGFFLTDIQVDLGNQGDGIQLFEKTEGAKLKLIPKVISVDLKFTERKPLYRGDWKAHIDNVFQKIKK